MLTRILGFILLAILILSIMDHYGIIQVTSIPLKDLIDALADLVKAIKVRATS